MDLNKVFLIGRLTQPPQLRTTPNGQSVCTFGLATNKINRDPKTGETRKTTEYHNIVLWRRLAEIASQYLAKGSLALIEGRLQTRSWKDPSGSQRYKTEVVAERMQLGPRPAGKTMPQPEEREVPTQKEEIPIIEENEEEIDVGEIPF